MNKLETFDLKKQINITRERAGNIKALRFYGQKLPRSF